MTSLTFDGNNAGTRTVNGGDGQRHAHGAANAQTLNGGDGNDTLNGGLGNDTENGGIGNDTSTRAPARETATTRSPAATTATRSTTAAARAAVTVALGEGGNGSGGVAGEGDVINADVENAAGGTVGDTLTGTAATTRSSETTAPTRSPVTAVPTTRSATPWRVRPIPAADIFNEGTTANGADTLNGGGDAGDVTNYSARTDGGVTVTTNSAPTTA